MFKFRIKYFISFIILLVIEICIALFAHDNFIRPYLGDFLVVILIYSFIQSFCKLPYFPTAIAVLLFSYIIEVFQYFNIVQILGLQHSTLARTIIGTSFAWQDIVAYTAGIGLVILLEKFFNNRFL
ncbi:MAG: DUF2809 domain-containing protein [Parafilimonas sp.]